VAGTDAAEGVRHQEEADEHPESDEAEPDGRDREVGDGFGVLLGNLCGSSEHDVLLVVLSVVRVSG